MISNKYLFYLLILLISGCSVKQPNTSEARKVIVQTNYHVVTNFSTRTQWISRLVYITNTVLITETNYLIKTNYVLETHTKQVFLTNFITQTRLALNTNFEPSQAQNKTDIVENIKSQIEAPLQNTTVPLPKKIVEKRIFWISSTPPAINSCTLDGGDPRVILSEGLNNPLELEIDRINGFLYFSDATDREIKRVTLDGKNLITITRVEGLTPAGLFYSEPSGSLYWSSLLQKTLFSLKNDSSTITSTPLLSSVSPYSLSIATKIDSLFLIPFRGTSLHFYQMTSGESRTLYSTLYKPSSLVIDEMNGYLFWSDSGLLNIQSGDFNGSEQKTIITIGLKFPLGMALDPEEKVIYWADFGANFIGKSKYDGTDVEFLIEKKAGKPKDVVIYY